MNLFVESITEYLKSEWKRVFESGQQKEARFIVQSLGPGPVVQIFSELEAYRLKWLKELNIKCYFKVATRLWEEWIQKSAGTAQLDNLMSDAGGLSESGTRLWIDEEDRLTWYRNRTAKDENVDGLVVVLVGLQHATDQGGLKDFHRVDEDRIWLLHNKNFDHWSERLQQRLSIEETGAEHFCLVLQELFRLRPRSLGKLADFLESSVIASGSCFDFKEVNALFFQNLAQWGMPTILAGEVSSEIAGKKGAEVLKHADAFISHQLYKSPASQRKDWDKIVKWLDGDSFEVPSVAPNLTVTTVSEYRDLLHDFIFDASASARSRLMEIDFLPLSKILKMREKKEAKEKKAVVAFGGSSLEAFLQGIWYSLKTQVTGPGSAKSFNDISGVELNLVRFDHDLVADEDEGLGADYLARELLKGCLGGLDTVLQDMACKVPANMEQFSLPRSSWEKPIEVNLKCDFENIACGRSRSRPNVQFEVKLLYGDSEECTSEVYKWLLGPTQPERVRYDCARKIRSQWNVSPKGRPSLPAHQIPVVLMTALYFAADEDEANRLLSQSMAEMQTIDLLEGLAIEHLAGDLVENLRILNSHYSGWLERFTEEGYYTARKDSLPQLLDSYTNLAGQLLQPSLAGSNELLRRFYKAFLVVARNTEANDPFLASAIAWGLTPAVLELSSAKVGFLSESFPEVVGEQALERNGDAAFTRMLALGEIQRPLAGLVINADKTLSAATKAFGLIHYLGAPPSTSKSLAVQTLLRDEETDDDDEISESSKQCEERDLVRRVLEEYLQLYPFSEDGMRIIAVNVRDLETIIAGIEAFLNDYLDRTSEDWPPFHCSLMIYSTSSSPMAMESRVARWREYMSEKRREKGRPLVLSVGHRYAPKEKIVSLLDMEQKIYDVAFLFHFLRGGLSGQAEPAKPYKFSFEGWRGLQFPIAEYPRPINQGDRYRRHSVLSNRRLLIQSKHADLSARLRYPTQNDSEHLIIGEVDYKPWMETVESLHRRAHWLACIDPFVDKRLLMSDANPANHRKIVGFKSGLGSYGELNLTISTQHDTLEQLTKMVSAHLSKLLPHSPAENFEQMAVRVVSEAEEVIGLASLRAVVGTHERIREVVGFAAIRRALASPQAAICQILPIDSVMHWFNGAAVKHRPDLLQLTLELRENLPPLIGAKLIECKLGQESSQTVAEASEQIEDGLQHLTELFAPMRRDLRRIGFDRRYWWAQLHRAMTSRAMVSMPEEQWKQLNRALENLSEGIFEIHWQCAIFTFWNDKPDLNPSLSKRGLSPSAVPEPFLAPPGFAIHHFEIGYMGLTSLFSDTPPWPPINLSGPALRIGTESPSEETVESVVTSSGSEAIGSNRSFDGGDQSGTTEQTSSEIGIVDQSTAPTPATNITRSSLKEAPVVADQAETGGQKELSTPTPSPKKETAIGQDAELTLGVSTVAAKSAEQLVPAQILIGTRKNGEPVYWHFGHPQLANRHLLIFGASGSGKTYGIQCLLSEMAVQRLHSLIVDYTDGFLPNQVEPKFKDMATPKNHYVFSERLPLNPFRRQKQIIDPSIPAFEETPYQVATRLQSIFSSVYEMGDQQAAALIRVLQAGIEESPNFGLDEVVARLENDNKNAATLASKIEPLVKAQPFRQSEDSNWGQMFGAENTMVHVLQLKGYAREIQRLITEFVLWDLWDYAQSTGNKNRPLPIVLDEIQNLDHSSDSPIDKMLREGRKFGLALILATQTTSQFDQEQKDRLFQAGHKLFFKPASTEVDRFAHLLAQATTDNKATWAQRLTSLEKGQCWSLGPVLRPGGLFKEEAVLVNVTQLEKRFQ